MSDYTFSTLAPNEFEDLTKDLLERHMGVPLQAFTTGRDRGIDLRFALVPGCNWIVQCKHYAGSRFADLKKCVEHEVVKIRHLKPDRYFLATSCGLTPDNVDALFALLSPYCRSKHDIIGKTDLNAILRANGDIERRHPKLWITSEPVLTRVLQNDVFVQSDMTRESILRRLSLYVYTERFEDARKKLNTNRVCIVSGVPGVGKTTLAEMLLLEHIMDDWELVTVHQNVSEGLRALQARPESKQIFYYDDFLGQVSSGEKLAKNEDAALLQLLRSIQHSASKRCVLTTREYILAQAKRVHEKLARANLDVHQFVVECRDYDEEAKARILANHLYFNNVPHEHLVALITTEGYREILEHDNYNPRLIESMTSRLEYESLNPAEYLRAFVARLDDPSQLWEHIYEEQLTEASRHVLLALTACGTPVAISTLEGDFDILFGYRSREYGWIQRPTAFERSLNELEGNFIRIRERDRERLVEWHNPSVLDFLGNWLRRHRRDLEALLATATRFGQVEQLTTTVLTSTDEQPGSLLPDEATLAEVMYRTLSATDATWQHLQTAIRLCGSFTGGPVRTATQQLGTALFDALECGVADVSVIVAVLSMVEKESWIDPAVLHGWRNQLKAYCLALEEEWFNQLDAFMPLARWASRQRPLFSDHEFASLQEFAARLVEIEADSDISPNLKSIWEDIKSSVEALEHVLGQDFGSEIGKIERKIEDADTPEPATEQVAGPVTRPPRSSVRSIFEALLQ